MIGFAMTWQQLVHRCFPTVIIEMTSGTRSVKTGDPSVVFNYGAYFYELSMVESKSSTHSRQEPGDRRRDPKNFFRRSMTKLNVSCCHSRRGPFFLARPRRLIHTFVFLSVHSSPFSSELSDAIKNWKEIRRMTSCLGRLNRQCRDSRSLI